MSRESAKETIGADRFVEVYIKASLAKCEERDPKGLYKKARKGEITNMTGISDPYEPPENPDILIETELGSPQESARALTRGLAKNGF